ncbi:hypothetical protein CYG49_03050 [Candidatus Saccharibacteria bacterium]|nr:MAG: hypothetical protein CYG49_03050 [Candidatus Saccharibacteria bacterium]
MKNNITTTFMAALASLLSTAVVLTGVHAAELTSLSTAAHAKQDHLAKKISEDGSTTKIHAELHNHVEKQGNHSIIKVVGDNNHMQADARSLRMHRHYAKAKLQKDQQFNPFALLLQRFALLTSV